MRPPIGVATPPGVVLAPRLVAVARLVPAGARVADIGSAHGQLALGLLAGGRATHCIASDRTATAGQRLAQLPRTPGLEVRFGDGLAVLRAEDRIDTVVLAGLGSRAISSILEGPGAELAGRARLVLQPQCEWSWLRRWLWRRGMAIVDEQLVLDSGRFYLVLAARPPATSGPPTPPYLSEEEAEGGPCLLRAGGPLVRRYWRQQLRRLESIAARAPCGPSRERAVHRAAMARRLLARLGNRFRVRASAARSRPVRRHLG